MRVHITDRRALDPNPFPTPGAFLRAVRAAAMGEIDPALRRFQAAQGSDESGLFDFAVPTTIAPVVLGTGADDDPAVGRMTPVPMETPTVSVDARVDKNHSTSTSGGLQVYRIPETNDITVSRQKYEQITLTANAAMALTFASQRVMTESPLAFAALLEQGYRDEFASFCLEERMWGTGVGQFTGVLRSPALITVAKESGQANDTIVWQNVVNMRARCWRYRQAVWLATQEAVPQLTTLTVPVGTGGAHVPAWTAGNSEDEMPDQLLGRPLYYSSDACSALGDFGDLVLINWGEYLDATYRPMEMVSSIHVRFQAVENAFRFSYRGDGSPWWRSALTPRRSTTTLSPYVALAAR